MKTILKFAVVLAVVVLGPGVKTRNVLAADASNEFAAADARILAEIHQHSELMGSPRISLRAHQSQASNE